MNKTEKFVIRSKKIHGNLYCYEFAEYVKSDQQVSIKCLIHGEFLQTPHSHLKGHGCPACGINKTRIKNSLTNKTFLQKAKKIHHNFYDYSKSKYKNYKTKIEIICPKHDLFLQTPENHLKGRGCPKCWKFSTEKLITKAKSVHDNFYDYSKSCYIDDKTKIDIICPIHGSFKQLPFNHLQGAGCQKCALSKNNRGGKLTTEKAIKKFATIHQNKYDYSLVVYNKTNEKVQIVCPVHGSFFMRPQNHLNGQGCPKCGTIKRAKKRMLNWDKLVLKLKKKHNNFYDYSKAKYINSNKKIKIICPVHGIFKQFPQDHLKGHGCNKCSKKRMIRSSKGQQELFSMLKKHFPKKVIEIEKNISLNENKFVQADICFLNERIIIEYNGDYWHCNPNKYKPDYYHFLNKKTAVEIWEKDEQRQKELERLDYKVIVVWESDFKKNKKNTMASIINSIN